MPNLNVRLTENERQRLQSACKGRGCSMSDLAKAALSQFLGGAQQQPPATASMKQDPPQPTPQYNIARPAPTGLQKGRVISLVRR